MFARTRSRTRSLVWSSQQRIVLDRRRRRCRTRTAPARHRRAPRQTCRSRTQRRRNRCCDRRRRGGVPVFSRPIVKPSERIDSASSHDGGSPCRPAGRCSCPTWISPLRKVPVVTTSARHVCASPSSIARPVTRPLSIRISPASPRIQSMFGSSSSAAATHRRRRCLSACARGDQTAGPRLRFSSLNWMPVASMARPIRPPSASISRTR